MEIETVNFEYCKISEQSSISIVKGNPLEERFSPILFLFLNKNVTSLEFNSWVPNTPLPKN